MTFVVEISNPERSNGKPYERWELGEVELLTDRLAKETGWDAEECERIARLIAEGDRGRLELPGPGGKTVVVYPKAAA